jgi:hypothetical protein
MRGMFMIALAAIEKSVFVYRSKMAELRRNAEAESALLSACNESKQLFNAMDITLAAHHLGARKDLNFKQCEIVLADGRSKLVGALDQLNELQKHNARQTREMAEIYAGLQHLLDKAENAFQQEASGEQAALDRLHELRTLLQEFMPE